MMNGHGPACRAFSGSAITGILGAALAVGAVRADNLLRLPGGWVWDGGNAVETAGGWIGSGWRSFPGVSPPWNPVAPAEELPLRSSRLDVPQVVVVRVEQAEAPERAGQERSRSDARGAATSAGARCSAASARMPVVSVGAGRPVQVDVRACIGILPPEEMLRRYAAHRDSQRRMAMPVELPPEAQ